MAYDYITSAGVIVPDTGDILTDTQNEFKSALGATLIVGRAAPQDILINTQVIARKTVTNNNAALANQINPNESGGTFLWSVGALTGLEPPVGSPTLVSGVTIAGVPFTFIEAGAQAATEAGDIFESLADITIPNSGTITVDFQSLASGPIPCGVNELTQILNGGILGWETVTNPNAGVPGVAALSDAAYRSLRNRTLALQGSGLIEAIKSRVSALPGVQSMSILENYEKPDLTIDGIFLLGNSVYACVNGGDSNQIFAALLASKSLGCNWNGTQTSNVIDPSSGQSYLVKFDRPAPVPIYLKVYARAPISIGNPTDDIKNAILAYVNGQLAGEDGFVVGGNVSSFELGGAINQLYPTIYVSKVQASTDGITYSSDEIAIAKNQIATTNADSIVVILS